MTPLKTSLQPSLRLATGGRIGVDLASGIGQTQYNTDFVCSQDQYVTGRSRKAEHSGAKPVGLFHELPIELQDSMVVTSKRKSRESQWKFRESLQMQRERRFEKKKEARNKKVEGEMTQVMANSNLWQKYDSPQCCKLARDALDLFNELSSKSAKLQLVKEKILIHVFGFGVGEGISPMAKK